MQSVAAIAVSTVLGFLSGLGVGGGSLLMLWLTGPLGWPQAQARALNLLVLSTDLVKVIVLSTLVFLVLV